MQQTAWESFDVAGGLAPALDLMSPEYPRDDPHYRESVSMWLRVHRRSSRNGVGFRGHVWATTVFPSAKAFGVLALPPIPGDNLHFREAFYFDGQTMQPADVCAVPWLTLAVSGPQDVSLMLRTGGREIRIAAEIYATNFSTARQAAEHVGVPMLQQQSCARYRMEGEEAFGMMERSNFLDLVTIVP